MQVSAAKFHSAAVTASGRLYSWGVGRGGRLGHPEPDVHSGYKAVIVPRLISALQGVRVVQVAAAKNHTVCCTAQGDLFAFGSNAEGQLGIPGEGFCAEPRRVPIGEASGWRPGREVRAVAAGSTHTAVVTASGAVFTCGLNDAWQLGYHTGEGPQGTLRRVEAVGKRAAGVACSRLHTVVLCADGEVLQWGHGLPGARRVIVPKNAVKGGRGGRAVVVAAGRAHSSAILDQGLVVRARDGCGTFQ